MTITEKEITQIVDFCITNNKTELLKSSIESGDLSEISFMMLEEAINFQIMFEKETTNNEIIKNGIFSKLINKQN